MASRVLKALILVFLAVLLIGSLPLKHVGLLWETLVVVGVFTVAYRLWRLWTRGRVAS